ncbi:MAG: imidazole glycerol phosphate synthase subunit HisH [Candidatus Margulisbacteria bacterium]|nr:imidazole glycerol phosphate synthase subunit HisH [Candidatus Margulisiibacteriota bacterium]
MIVIVDYGLGNLGSILNMLKKIGAEARISSDVSVIEKADKLILPGVGAFDNGMRNINDLGLLGVLEQKALKENVPVLGICLGMQLLTAKSEEGERPGLGWVEAKTVRFKFDDDSSKGLKVPHMGWNNICRVKNNPLFSGENDERFYFVHSYHVVCHDKENVISLTKYGYDFVSGFQKDNIYGVQFHPEKSHKYGMRLLRNFAELC